jgi:hypothetical protein
MSIHLVADHALRAKGEDVIFGISARAEAKAKEIGSENIINSTIGALWTTKAN